MRLAAFRYLLISCLLVGVSGCLECCWNRSLVRVWGDHNSLGRPAVFVERVHRQPARYTRVADYRWMYNEWPRQAAVLPAETVPPETASGEFMPSEERPSGKVTPPADELDPVEPPRDRPPQVPPAPPATPTRHSPEDGEISRSETPLQLTTHQWQAAPLLPDDAHRSNAPAPDQRCQHAASPTTSNGAWLYRHP